MTDLIDGTLRVLGGQLGGRISKPGDDWYGDATAMVSARRRRTILASENIAVTTPKFPPPPRNAQNKSSSRPR
jgi:hypothetical protein